MGGIDEVGRGCLAGPVVAAAVVFEQGCFPAGLADSKLVSPKNREKLAAVVKYHAVDVAVGRSEPSEIDELNIHHATLLAMCRAFNGLSRRPDWLDVDGRFYPSVDCPGRAVIGGDRTVGQISAASIVAKVSRDAELIVLDGFASQYGFRCHKGYPSPFHLEMLREYGPSAWHRRSFKPVLHYLLGDT